MKFWFRLAIISCCTLGAWAQPATGSVASVAAKKSGLDAELFFQILLGELSVREGSAGSGFSLILDAARRTRDPLLFQRAVDLALQSRSGEAALQAAQAWKKDVPQATEANRYILQILLALNRLDDAGKALAVSLRELPASEQNVAIASIPRVFSRVPDKKLAADTVAKALTPSTQTAATAASAWTTIGRMRREAGQLALAIEAVRQGHAADVQAQGPLILALSLFNAAAEPLQPLLTEAMQTQVAPELRLGYARGLISQLNYPQALEQLRRLNNEQDTFADGWLVHGLLLQETGQLDEASQKLSRYVQLSRSLNDKNPHIGLTEALLALAQIAQQQGQLQQAAQWLAQVPADADPFKLASRQADLLTQQGRLEEARQVLMQIQATTPEHKVRKTLVLSQWMRGHQQVGLAYELVKQSMAQLPGQFELMTELALLSEKLKRFDDMESLLRELMKIRPEDPHAFNALGYSLADRNLRLNEAREWITQAVKLAPQDPFIQDSLGWVAFRQGQYQEALAILRAAYKAKPDAEIAAHLGEVLWVLGQHQEAATVWREGLLLKAHNETLQETLNRFKFKP